MKRKLQNNKSNSKNQERTPKKETKFSNLCHPDRDQLMQNKYGLTKIVLADGRIIYQ